MADKELLDRVTVAVEDAEATPDRELDWTRHQVPAKSPYRTAWKAVPTAPSGASTCGQARSQLPAIDGG
jgi:hypothetical protein